MGPDDGGWGRCGEPAEPECDLLQRYERMIQTQITTIDGIDEKAAATSRLVGLLVGLLLSAVSIVAGFENVRITFATGALLATVALSVVCFFVSLVYAVVTYLSSEFAYGPTASLGNVLASNDVASNSYRRLLLTGYSDAIRANRRVVRTNATRFERSLAAFLGGIVFLFAAGILIVLPLTPLMEWGLLVVCCLVVGRLIVFVVGQEYLTLERVP